MMHRRGESDSRHSSWEADEQGGSDPLRSRWSQGRRPKGILRGSKARTGHRVGEPVSQALERIRPKLARQRKEEKFTRAPPPHQHLIMLDEAFPIRT